MAAHLVLPWIHQVFSNLKGWARGVYHGLRAKHLQSYLDEFVFRFNRRRTRHAAFRSLFGIEPCARPLSSRTAGQQCTRYLVATIGPPGSSPLPQLECAKSKRSWHPNWHRTVRDGMG